MAGSRGRFAAPTVRLFMVLVPGLALAIAGCGASSVASPSAAPSPTPVPSPSPSPDPVAGFVERAVDVQANGRAVVAGTLTAGDGSGEVTGRFEFDGRDSRSERSVTVAGVTTATERIERLGEAWQRTLPGPWLAVDPPAAGRTLAEVLQSIDAVEDVGVESRDGRSLHRLRPRALTVPPAAVALDPAITDPQISIEFLVEPDGTPVVMVVAASWTQAAAGTPVAHAMDLAYTFEEWGTGVAIRPPDDVWVVHTSEDLGYSMAYPDGWTVTRTNGQDAFGRDGAGFVYVAPQTLKSPLTTEQFRDAVVEASKAELGGAPEAVAPTRLGGQAAWRTTHHTKDASGTSILLVDYLTVRGSVGWEIYLVTLAGDTEERDLAFLEAFIASFAFTD